MNESIEIKEKHNVVWMYNNLTYQRICDTLDEAMRIRDRIIDAKGWNVTNVSIHLIQINKFGDRTVL